MSLFNYDGCKKCSNSKNDCKLVLHHLFPANVCNNIFEYDDECSKCKWMKENENKFLQNFEGMLKRNEIIVGVPRLNKLTNAERQIFFFKQQQKSTYYIYKI